MNYLHHTGIYWFNNDLRLADNEALTRFCEQASHAIFVYVLDPRWFKSSHYQSRHMGLYRWRFICEALQAINEQLESHGSGLHIKIGYPTEVLSHLITTNNATLLAGNRFAGVYEKRQWRHVVGQFPDLTTLVESGHTLFTEEQLPFALDALPGHFTPFRKKVEKLSVASLSHPVGTIPALPKNFRLENELDTVPIHWPHMRHPEDNNTDCLFKGGSSAGLDRLDYYLYQSKKVLRYKQTRNALDEFDASAKLSPWLACGSISARQVFHHLKSFEETIEANESTYWLYFELLWREYFQWYLEKHGKNLFRYRGVQGKAIITSFWPERFQKWCTGNTPYPLVNACMKQLNATGYMSNRGRQIAASCLVNELQLDWRYGAAYFEQQLVDFDVASNWGNWQYLAGVGADPRGARQFDIQKQAATYDPDGAFVQKWRGEQNRLPLDSTDMVDWPIQWH